MVQPLSLYTGGIGVPRAGFVGAQAVIRNRDRTPPRERCRVPQSGGMVSVTCRPSGMVESHDTTHSPRAVFFESMCSCQMR